MIDRVEGTLGKWNTIAPISPGTDARNSPSSKGPEKAVVVTREDGPRHWRPYLIMVQYHPRTSEPIEDHCGELDVEHGSKKYKNARYPKYPADCQRLPVYYPHNCFDT